MIRYLIFLFLLAFTMDDAFSQLSASKKRLEITSTADDWEKLSTRNVLISGDGKFCVYTIEHGNPVKQTTIIQGTDKHWTIPVANAGQSKITSTNEHVLLAMSGDSLCIIDVRLKSKTIYPQVESFKIPAKGDKRLIAYKLKNGRVILENLKSHKNIVCERVDQYFFNEDGSALIISDSNSLHWVNSKGIKKSLFNQGRVNNITFDHSGNALAFIYNAKDGNAVYYYHQQMDSAIMLVNNAVVEQGNKEKVADKSLHFGKDNRNLFFFYTNESHKYETAVGKTENILYSYNQPSPKQLKDWKDKSLTAHLGKIDIANKKLVHIANNYTEGFSNLNFNDQYCFQAQDHDSRRFPLWDVRSKEKEIYLISIKDGSKRLVAKETLLGNTLTFSANKKYLIYFDRKQLSYFSYNIEKRTLVNLSENIPFSLYNDDWDQKEPVADGFPIQGYFDRSNDVLLCDKYDLWRVDLEGRNRPLNITHGYGRLNNLSFRILKFENVNITQSLRMGEKVILSARNEITKEEGFFRIQIGERSDPRKLCMGQALLSHLILNKLSHIPPATGAAATLPIKSTFKNAYLVTKMSASESPNLYYTTDYASFKSLTSIRPEKNFNWLYTEMISYPVADKIRNAVIYKPEDFDSTKRYPVIFYYYEHNSDYKNLFLYPSLASTGLPIPYYVSNGYLVCVPDIHYTVGEPGASALQCVSGAADYLSKLPYIDASKFGLQGHSFGGYETNYIVSHTNRFAVAVSAAGVSDVIGKSYGLNNGYLHAENGQGRIGKTLWEAPDLYIRNSPVFSADKVTTPILIQVGTLDENVSPTQGREFYSALKRLGKRAWLIDYQNGRHILYDETNCLDYTRRMQQLFDHYLKQAPAAMWMTKGIQGDAGFVIDTSGASP